MQSWRRTFMTIWTGQAISILASSVLQMSIVWYLTRETGSAAILTLSTLIAYLPQAVLGPFIGVFIDRYPRKTVMILANIGTALAGLVLVVAGAFGPIPIWLIFLVLFIRSIGSTFHAPALQAVTPLLVPPEEITKCAGYSQTFKSLSLVLSPALAGMLFSVWELDQIIVLDVAAALLAVGILCTLKIPTLVKEPAHQSPNLIQEAKEGIQVLRSKPGLIALLVISVLYALIYFPIGTLYPLITMTYFGGGVKESGVVEMVFSGGMLAGSFLLGLVGNKIRKMPVILLSIGAYGAGVLAAGLLPPSGLPTFVALSGLMGITSPFFFGVQTAVYQTSIEGKYLGRVLSLTSSLSLFAMPLGLILAGSFAQVMGVNRWFALSGILTLLLAVGALFVPTVRKACQE